jgi:putative ABC transport system substrate-binding protein
MNKKITRRVFCLMLLALSFSAHAQQPGKMFRIGFLELTSASGSATLVKTIQQELTKLGWIEGKNIAIEYRFADQNAERLPELAADLVGRKVDVILCGSTASTRAAKNATSTIPIVMASASDPIGSGLVASLAQPGGNVTGFSSLDTELNSKRLEILKDAVPKLARVGFLRQIGTSEVQFQEIKPAAVALKLKLEVIETRVDAKGLESAFQTAKQKQVGAIMPGVGRLFAVERKRVVDLATKYRLPAIYFAKSFVNEGGLMSYGVDYQDQYRKAAQYVDKILRGTKPEDLPVQQPMRFEFVISLPAAEKIGHKIPYELLWRANQVIK